MGFSDNDSESDSDVEAGDARKDSVASDVSFASYVCVVCSALCENGLIASKSFQFLLLVGNIYVKLISAVFVHIQSLFSICFKRL